MTPVATTRADERELYVFTHFVGRMCRILRPAAIRVCVICTTVLRPGSQPPQFHRES